MRVPVLLLCSAFAIQGANAAPLSDADRETLLENLEKIRASAESTVDARFRLALVAYRNAMQSDQAAIDLYLNCLEKVNFSDQQKKPADFREWKRKEAERLSDAGLRIALRHQLRWLMLTLEAASAKANRPKLAAEAQEIVDTIFRDPEKMKNQANILSQAVTSTVFAKAYDITNVKVENWALSPTDLDSIYDEILLPPVRTPDRLAELRGRWIKRIQQEGAKVEYWGNPRENRGDRGEDREDKKIGTITSMQSPEYLKFIQETQPKMQWDMEVDLFENGDESGASVRMLAHLQKYIAHASAREWGTEFQKLLTPAAVTPPAKPAATSENAGTTTAP